MSQQSSPRWGRCVGSSTASPCMPDDFTSSLLHGEDFTKSGADHSPFISLPVMLTAVCQQAAGSSLLAKLCNILVQDALGRAGMLDVGAVTVLPVATGMALTLTLLAMKAQRPAAAR